ncbi:ASN_collapsed_G0029420.mRNA.1.CDS.1 [Saccharomyces cerevisiae]|nr:ASN_collapsed_G0029420.mRNA.1.CDS.1 [Saccharomyces cerevisiae]
MSNAALQVYGGDEVSAVVIDPGSYTTNIGYSGSDFPQSILPSVYGKYTADEGNKKIFSEQSIGIPRKDYELKPIIENGPSHRLGYRTRTVAMGIAERTLFEFQLRNTSSVN